MTSITTLSDELQRVVQPVFNLLPPSRAMNELVVTDTASPDALEAVERAIAGGRFMDAAPELAAGLWLYVDDLERSHRVSQNIASPTGSFWHAIMHRREGDFSNSRYWFRKVGKHPAYSRIHIAGGPAAAGTNEAHYHPTRLVDRVERAYNAGETQHPELVAMQRHEWFGLFEWCVEHAER